jgi:hypothetical protein
MPSEKAAVMLGNDCVFLIAAKGQKGDTAANLRPSAPLAH